MPFVEYLLTLLGFLPWWMALPPIVFIGILFVINWRGWWKKLGFQFSKLNKKQFTVSSITIILISIASVIPVLMEMTTLTKRNRHLENILGGVVQGTIADEDIDTIPISTEDTIDCKKWDICSDFKSDNNLENKYYRHTEEDSQRIILESGPFTNPPLYLEKEVKPFYFFKLDVQPLDADAANILIESRDMFQLFIGDNDYRSLAFLTWNQRQSKWERTADSKIYLGRDLELADMEPKTQLSVSINSKKKGNNAEILFEIRYKTVDNENKTARFTKTVIIPAVDADKLLTQVGTGLFRSKGNIPQARFMFMALKEN